MLIELLDRDRRSARRRLHRARTAEARRSDARSRQRSRAELKDPPFNPRIPAQLATVDDIFSIIRSGDVLLHRPYDSFTAVVEFVQAAAEDPDVVAIKQTLYRTDAGSPIIEALAARRRATASR